VVWFTESYHRSSLHLIPRTDLKNITIVQGSGGISQISKKANIVIFTMGYFSTECALARAGYMNAHSKFDFEPPLFFCLS